MSTTSILDSIKSLSISEIKQLARGHSPAVQSALIELAIALLYEREGEPIFSVKILSYEDRKIDVIKAVRSVRMMSLMEAKSLVEDAPVIVFSDLDEATAIDAADWLRKAGALVEVTKQ